MEPTAMEQQTERQTAQQAEQQARQQTGRQTRQRTDKQPEQQAGQQAGQQVEQQTAQQTERQTAQQAGQQHSELLDVAIIGGGPAGLSAALVLGRARKRVAVIDEGRPRNRVTHEMHGFLSRDGVEPSEFRRVAKEQIGSYPTVSFVEDAAAAVTGADGDFHIATADGRTYQSKKLLFAVGRKDVLPDIEGLADVYGKSAFVCPYCDGWELRDRPLAILVNGADAMHMAALISGWTDRFALCTNGPDGLTEAQREELRKHRIPLYDAPIRRIDSDGEGMVRQVVLQDGTAVACGGIFFKPTLVAGSDLLQALGCHVSEAGAVTVDVLGKTNVPGVYSAGDAATQFHQAVTAAASGSLAAAGINNELNQQAWHSAAH